MTRVISFRTKSTMKTLVVFLMLLTIVTPKAAQAADTTARFSVEQTFNTSSINTEERFTYILMPNNPQNPMPSGSAANGYTFEIIGNRSVLVVIPGFTRQGGYVYTLRQIIEVEKTGFIYDRSLYRIEIHIDESLKVYVIVKDSNNDKLGEIVFENSNDGDDETPTTEPPDPTRPTNPPTTTEPTRPTNPPTTDPTRPTSPPGTIEPTEPTTDPVTTDPTEPTTSPVTTDPTTTDSTDPSDEPSTGNGVSIEEPPIPGEAVVTTGSTNDEVVINGRPPGSNLPNTGGGPKTGDDSNTALDIALFVSGGMLTAGTALLIIIREKRKKQGE